MAKVLIIIGVIKYEYFGKNILTHGCTNTRTAISIRIIEMEKRANAFFIYFTRNGMFFLRLINSGYIISPIVFGIISIKEKKKNIIVYSPTLASPP